MILKDNVETKGINEIRGIFSIKSFKKDGTVEEYKEKPNLIMDTARSNMAELVGGLSSGSPINKFVLGNKGHVGTDILDYKRVGTIDSFVSSRTELFSQDPAHDNSNGKTSFVYEIDFNVQGSNPSQVDTQALGRVAGSTITQPCEVLRVVADRTCTYTITIPDNAGNDTTTNGAVVAYTEAALYAGSDIFSMKTFPARVKENTVKFEITWSIIF